MQEIQLSEDFSLPLKAITETFALLAKRGSGKTYTARVMAEGMINASLPIAVLDPTGAWWGLRSSADGQSEGLPVVVFGGDHGDVPLEEGSGELLADVLIEQRFPAVFDLSVLSKAAARRWATDFAERLYHKNREAMHLFIDEADVFAPQRIPPGGERLFGAIDDLVRRGRIRGIGLTLITQRPAVLNKDVLTQTEVLMALRMNSTLDVKAIDDWVRLHADEAEAKALKDSLPSLPVGTAWIWSPGWLNVLQKIKIRRAQTFDSSATPEPGQTRVEPRKFAKVDLEQLGERIAATLERAKEDDPDVLKRRLREAEKRLAEQPERIEYKERIVVQKVNVLNEGEVRHLEEQGHQLIALGKELVGFGNELIGRLSSVRQMAEESVPPLPTEAESKPPVDVPPVEPVSTPEPPAVPADQGGNLSTAQLAIIDTLEVFHSMGLKSVARSNVATWAKQSPKSSSYGMNLRALREEGWIEYPADGHLALTRKGHGISAPAKTHLTQADLQSAWIIRLDTAQGAIVKAVCHVHPRSISRRDLAQMIGVSPTSSSYGVNLSALKELGLITYPESGKVMATQLLFPKGLG